MIKVTYRRRAIADLLSIRRYYLPIDPVALDNVLDDIDRSIALIAHHPFAGPAGRHRPVRWIVTRRYGYKVTYVIERGELQIIGIFRYQNRKY